MDRSRRSFLKLGLTTAGMMALSEAEDRVLWNDVAQAVGETLGIMFTGGTWKRDFEKTFTIPFSQKYGVKFIIEPGESVAQMIKVMAEKDNQSFDFIHLQQDNTAQLGFQGLLEEWKESEIPNLKDVHPAFKNPYSAGKVVSPLGIAYNVKKSPKKVTSWLDLWDPAFKGKVAIPKWGWIGGRWFNGINKVLGGSEENIEPGIKKCRELVQENKAIIMDSNEHGQKLFVSEEILIASYYTARTEYAKRAGAPVEFVYPREGAFCWYFATAWIKERPRENREAALKFINYTLDPEKQLEFSLLVGYPPTNVKAIGKIPPSRPDLILSEETMNNLNKIKVDYVKMFQYFDRSAERWMKEVLGGG